MTLVALCEHQCYSEEIKQWHSKHSNIMDTQIYGATLQVHGNTQNTWN